MSKTTLDITDGHYTRMRLGEEEHHFHPDCGCRLTHDPDAGTVSLFQCPMHEAAPMMLTVLARCECIIADHVAGVERSAWPEMLRAVRAAIAQARGTA